MAGDGLRFAKIRRLLVRQGGRIVHPTPHRLAILELQFGKTATTIPVLDGEPGPELQLDTGGVGWLTLPRGKKRRFRAWIVTAVRSRNRLVYPTFKETTVRAIEACEAAWEFFGWGLQGPDPGNTKAIVIEANPLAAHHARVSGVRAGCDFHIDLPSHTTHFPAVRRWSTIRGAHRTYSVPAQSMGHTVGARVHPNLVEVRYRDDLRADDAASAR